MKRSITKAADLASLERLLRDGEVARVGRYAFAAHDMGDWTLRVWAVDQLGLGDEDFVAMAVLVHQRAVDAPKGDPQAAEPIAFDLWARLCWAVATAPQADTPVDVGTFHMRWLPAKAHRGRVLCSSAASQHEAMGKCPPSSRFLRKYIRRCSGRLALLAAQDKHAQAAAAFPRSCRWTLRGDELRCEVDPRAMLGGVLDAPRSGSEPCLQLSDGANVLTHSLRMLRQCRELLKRTDLACYVDHEGLHFRWKAGRGGLDVYPLERMWRHGAPRFTNNVVGQLVLPKMPAKVARAIAA